MGRIQKDVTKLTVVGEDVSKTPVSLPFTISAGGSRSIVVGLTVTSVTSTTAISATLQTSLDGTTWVDGPSSAAITTAGQVLIKADIAKAADQTHMPLLGMGRIVVTTGATDAVTVNKVVVLQEA